MREKYESLSLAVLKELAKARGLKSISAMRKPELIERMLMEDEKDAQKSEARKPEEIKNTEKKTEDIKESKDIQKNSEENKKSSEDNKKSSEDNKKGSEDNKKSSEENKKTPEENKKISGEIEGKSEDTVQKIEKTAAETLEKDENRRRMPRREYPARETRPRREYTSAQNTSQREASSPAKTRMTRNVSPAETPVPAANAQVQNSSISGTSTENQTEHTASANTMMQNQAAQSPASVNPPAQNQPSPNEASQNTENTDTENGVKAGIAAETAQLDSGEKANGILEVMQDGYGFIRCENFLPGENDIYVSPSQIRRFNMKTGDIIQGNIRVKTQGEKFSALLYVTSINGFHPSEGPKRGNFEDMTPIFPNSRLFLERPGGTTAMRIVDLISPIGKGQRGMIVSPPKAGKTTLLKDVAKSILRNNSDMHLIILLIDERPEEVTDIKEAIQGKNVEVIYSTFDETPERHKRVSEMVIERAKRLVEHKKDVTILLDSITRLARAYNLVIPPSGRTLSGGLDPAALHMPKRFFGAARNMREGGSLTILATALVDTGSKMDDVIYEEFKGTGNMELVLDRKLQEKRVFPAIDIQKSGTRREDLLLSREEQETVYNMRRALNGMKADEAVEQILNMFSRTKTNMEFIQTAKKQKFL